MSTESTEQKHNLSGSRRHFLKSSGLLALSAPALVAASPRTMPGQANWWRGRRRLNLLAEGYVNPAFVLPPPTEPIPEGMAIRMRVIFPASDDKGLLAVQITLEAGGQELMPLSLIEVEVSDVTFGSRPVDDSDGCKPAIALSGQVVANPVPSPFGDLTGEPMTVSAGYEILNPHTGEAQFTFLAALGAGSHVSVCPNAVGMLQVRP